MKIIRSILCIILISYPLIGAQYLSAHDTWWGRFKKSVTSFWSANNSAETPVEYQPAKPVERVDRETKSAAASSVHADLELDDEVMTKGDYALKYIGIGLNAGLKVLNKTQLQELTHNVLQDLESGQSYYESMGELRKLLYPDINMRQHQILSFAEVINNSLKNLNQPISFEDRDCMCGLIVNPNRHPTPQEKKIIKKIRLKLEKEFEQRDVIQETSLPLFTEAVKDTISVGGAALSNKMIDSDLISPFADTIGLVVSKQVMADNYPKNKRFKLKAREVGTSFLTDACYAVTKFTLDEACKDSFGTICKCPWNKKNSFFHHFVGTAVELIARQIVKTAMRNYLINPLVSSIFGQPAQKAKKIGNLARAKIALRTMQKQRELQEELAHA